MILHIMAEKQMAEKRPRRNLTLQCKYEIVMFMDKNPQMSRKEFSEHFSVPGPTLTHLGANTHEIWKLYEEKKVAIDLI